MSKHFKKPTKSSKGFRHTRLTTVLVATVILAIAAVTVASRQKAKVNAAGEAARISQVAKKANYVTVKVAGQDVQVDGQTGKMKALTPEEAQKLAAGLGKVINQSAEGLVQVQHPDGSVSMDLEGRFQNVAVARVNEDGTVSQSCVDNPEAAGEFFGIEPKLIDEKSKTTRTENHANRTVVKTQR